MGPLPDYYAILGVLPNSEDVVIRGAYRALMQKYHPDKFQGPRDIGERKAKEINAAYEVLGDLERRKRYDASRLSASASARARAHPGAENYGASYGPRPGRSSGPSPNTATWRNGMPTQPKGGGYLRYWAMLFVIVGVSRAILQPTAQPVSPPAPYGSISPSKDALASPSADVPNMRTPPIATASPPGDTGTGQALAVPPTQASAEARPSTSAPSEPKNLPPGRLASRQRGNPPPEVIDQADQRNRSQSDARAEEQRIERALDALANRAQRRAEAPAVPSGPPPPPKTVLRSSVVALPEHATLDYSGNGWMCERGYQQRGGACVSVVLPEHATLDYSGNGWMCERGYQQHGGACASVVLPEHATLDYSGNGWMCERGYRSLGGGCVLVGIVRE